MNCPLYDIHATSQQKAHGCACGSPVCNPSGDCGGHLSQGNCTVPAIVWKTIFLKQLEQQHA